MQESKKILSFNEHSPYFRDFYQFFNNIVIYDKIQFPNNGKPCKVIMITSAVEKEGKTTIAALLAITGALSTKNFHLLLDGDLHRPSVHKKFGMQLKGGLTEVLMNKRELHNIVRRTPFGFLHLITAGSIVSNPFQLLDTVKMKKMLKYLGNYYEMIVVDCPPIIPISDALKLAQLADGVILTVKAGKTPKELVKRTIDILNKSRCPLLGVVLNDVSEVLPYYYNSKYYQYSY